MGSLSYACGEEGREESRAEILGLTTYKGARDKIESSKLTTKKGRKIRDCSVRRNKRKQDRRRRAASFIESHGDRINKRQKALPMRWRCIEGEKEQKTRR